MSKNLMTNLSLLLLSGTASQQSANQMNFILANSDAKTIKNIGLDDYYGVLSKNVPLSKLTGNANPIILLVATYDGLTPVPDARLGLNEFASGAISVLQAAKLLQSVAEKNDEPE